MVDNSLQTYLMWFQSTNILNYFFKKKFILKQNFANLQDDSTHVTKTIAKITMVAVYIIFVLHTLTLKVQLYQKDQYIYTSTISSNDFIFILKTAFIGINFYKNWYHTYHEWLDFS